MSKKLLLADDSITIQRVIELTFAEEDIAVVAVGDGRQAIDRLDRDPPDIVLADVGMPQLDGYGVASYMKSKPHLAKIPVILLAGAFDPVDEARAKSAGCDGVLAKPFEPQQVIARVRQLLERGKDGGVGAIGAPVSTPAVDTAKTNKAAAAGGSANQTPSPQAAAAPPANQAAWSLDDYFDRLDRDLTAATSPAPPPSPPSATGGARTAADMDWLPPAPATPATGQRAPGAPPPAIPQDWFPRPLATDAAAARSAEQAPTPGDAASPATYAGPPTAAESTLSIADAFAALLAAEQGAPPPPPQFPVNEDTIELIVSRVIERMTGGAVSDIVTEVAERLVRAEIEKIKNAH